MTGLLELREKIKMIYSRNEVFILPIVKFLLAFLTLNMINGKMGYMTRLDSIAIVLIAALLCSFLPAGSILLFAALFSLAHMYALSVEAAIVGLCVYVLLLILFLRFNHKEAIVVVLTAVLCSLKIPYVMPVAMGLIGSPASAMSVCCGVVAYYVLQAINSSASTIGTMGEDAATEKLRLMIDGIAGNKEMLVMVAAFAITLLVVYMIRRMSIDYNWTIAMLAGAITNLMILLIGDLMYGTNISVFGVILGAVVSVAVAKCIEFFRFCVDFSRTEKVQFEDDEYYYYVKAVPKMTVAAPTKTVKKINAQRRPAQREAAGTRRVTTEKVGRGTRQQHPGRNQEGYGYKNGHMNGGRSVTINGSMTRENTNGMSDDYEELF